MTQDIMTAQENQTIGLPQEIIDEIKELFLDYFLIDFPKLARKRSQMENLINEYIILFSVDELFLNGKQVKAILRKSEKTIRIYDSLLFNQKIASLIHEWVHVLDFKFNLSGHEEEITKENKIEKMDSFASQKTTKNYFRLKVDGFLN
jgi:hypothetical protein